MLLSELLNKNIIVKCIVRSDINGYIGSFEALGKVEDVSDDIYVRVKSGSYAGKIWGINTEDIDITGADEDSYILGGTGKWEAQKAEHVKDIDFLIEWHIDDTTLKEDKRYDSVPEKVINDIDLLKKDEEEKKEKKGGMLLPLTPKKNNDSFKPEEITTPVSPGAFTVVRFDSERAYNKLSRITREEYDTEEEANAVMADAARSFANTVKKGGHLIDIKRLSANSIRVEYVDNNGKEAFVIFQIFEG